MVFPSVVPEGNLRGLAAERQPLHDDGGLHTHAAGTQQLRRCCRVATSCLGDDALGAVHQLGVGWAHVDHQVAEGRARAHHHAGGEHVQHQLGRGTGLQARGAGEDLRSGGGRNGDLGCPGECGAGNAAQADGERAQALRVRHPAKHIGRAPTGGYTDEGVLCTPRFGAEAGVPEIACALLGRVLGMLTGEPQGAVPTGDQPLHQPRIDGKRGRALAGIQNAEPAAGPRAEIEQAAAAPEAVGDRVHRAGNRRQLRPHGCGHPGVLVVDDPQQLGRGELIQSLGCGVASLSGQRAEAIFCFVRSSFHWESS